MKKGGAIRKMATSKNRYQYETSPRKIEPNYVPKKKVAPKKNTKASTTKKTTNKKKKAGKQKQVEKSVIKYLIVGFAIFFAIAYRNSKIDENFAKVQDLKSELSEIQKQNVQLEISIENSLNLNNLEQQAKELLGMQKLSNRQTVYVNYPKEDYIEIESEKVIIEEDTSVFQKIKNWFAGI